MFKDRKKKKAAVLSLTCCALLAAFGFTIGAGNWLKSQTPMVLETVSDGLNPAPSKRRKPSRLPPKMNLTVV